MQPTTQNTAVGVFEDRGRARGAVHALRQAGFRDEEIGFLTRDEAAGVRRTGEATGTHWEAGAGIGAAAGAATGLGLGIAVATGLIGPIAVVAGGTLAALLASAGAGAAVGSVLGALTGLGIPEDEAGYYQSEFETGRTLVTVRAPGRAREAHDIMRRHGAVEHRYTEAVPPAGYPIPPVM